MGCSPGIDIVSDVDGLSPTHGILVCPNSLGIYLSGSVFAVQDYPLAYTSYLLCMNLAGAGRRGPLLG